MFNSIFRKQFVLYMGTLALSFSLLGVALTLAFQSYFVNQKEDQLIEQGKKISDIYERAYRVGILDITKYNQILSEVRILHEYLNASFMFIDTNYIVQWASSDISDEVLNTILELEALKPIMSGEIVTTQGRLGSTYKYAVLTVGCPVVVAGRTVGGVLMSSSMPELQKTIADVFRITLTSLCFSLWIAFFLVYISSRTISKPLHEMNEAAKVIANGHFEKRIAVVTKDEVGQLAESFNNMADSLNQQEKQRRDFIANISHDIRSPLTSIRGFLHALLDGTIPPERQNRYLEIVLDETERLSKLANDILDLNKVADPTLCLDKTNFDINSLIKRTISKLESRIIEKDLKLQVIFADESNIVHADYEKIERVIYNLLDNAIKFTQEVITIETSIKDSYVRVSFQDDGSGVSPEDQKKVFDRFYKGDSSRGLDKTGSGLGLSIVREFIKAHDETVSLFSEEGKGCRFEFKLPLCDDLSIVK